MSTTLSSKNDVRWSLVGTDIQSPHRFSSTMYVRRGAAAVLVDYQANFGHTVDVRFSQQLIARFLIFSDRLLNILLAMYLDSNKGASNLAKITVFLHFSYN